jgi:hypothetical protein
MNLLRANSLKPAILSGVLALSLPAMFGCSSQEAERTEDPAEIEKERLKHVEMSQREMRESN